MRLNSMFPSIENLNKERNKKKEEENGELFMKALGIRSRGGLSDPYEQNVQEEVVLRVLFY